ncbi:MAG: ribosome biogenesis GTP-binding protein YihA/YsxC [Alphaproteobacteria bacterium]
MDHHEAHGRESLTPPDAEALAAAERLFARPCRFTISAAKESDLPTPTLPEIAFTGRSNVGKSSLLNALVGRRDLARTSQTPGRTRMLNLFDLDGRLVLVDLPGYGHASAPRAEIKAWTGLAERYLRGRPTLRRVLVLIDARRGAMAGDRAVMAALDAAAVVYQAILTKADAVKPGALAQRLAALEAELARRPAAYPVVIATSARTGAGIAALRVSLARLAGEPDLA